MKVFIPAVFEKSDRQKEQMRIRGYASTPDIDRQHEQVLQEGLEIEDFLEHGFFNLDHRADVIVGYPDKEKTKITPKGLYVEGTILDTPVGRNLWDAAVALQKSNAPRRLGFSIEGQILSKDDQGNILKAKVLHVAITSTPVNTKATWEAFVKSMSCGLGEQRANALVRQSLERAVRCFQQGLDGDLDTLHLLQQWQERLNRSKDPEDIRLYLRLFKDIQGSKLDETTKNILSSMEKEEEK